MHARSGSGLDAQTDARTLGYCNCQAVTGVRPLPLPEPEARGRCRRSRLLRQRGPQACTLRDNGKDLFTCTEPPLSEDYHTRALLSALRALTSVTTIKNARSGGACKPRHSSPFNAEHLRTAMGARTPGRRTAPHKAPRAAARLTILPAVNAPQSKPPTHIDYLLASAATGAGEERPAMTAEPPAKISERQVTSGPCDVPSCCCANE